MKDITDSDIEHNIPLVCNIDVEWLTDIYIAGPCTVESYDQMRSIAKILWRNGVDYIRGGAYKPLTFPYRNSNMYELREEGVQILSDIKQEFELKVVSEVTEIASLSLVTDVYDVIQIGSRNMYNYELLRAVAETGKPILLKRHFGASLRDWLGATEYILNAGNEKVILCERGVTAANTHSTTSRFIADIQVIPMIKKYTNLPVIFDPSHATFNSSIVPDMLYAAMAAGCDGYIIETHPTPDQAAVDRLNAVDLETYSRAHNKVLEIRELFK